MKTKKLTDRPYPVIDMRATGRNIQRLREAKGLSVKDLQEWFGFEEPRAVYKWQSGQSLPSVDNLFALGYLLDVPMENILVQAVYKLNFLPCEQSAEPDCQIVLYRLYYRSDSGSYCAYRLGFPAEVRGVW